MIRSPEGVLIQTERLILRLPKRGDEAEIARFYSENRAFLQPWSPTFEHAIMTVSGWRDRIDATRAEFRGGRGLRLIILLRADSATRPHVIGVANFTSITGFPTFMCNLGYSLSESAQGQGYMVEALEAAIRYVFTELGLHRIEANYLPRNTRSGKVLQKLGFTIEGQSKDYILIDGRWEDHVRTSLTNLEWMEAT